MTNGELSELIKNEIKKSGTEDIDFEASCIFEDIMKLDALSFAIKRNEEADAPSAERAIKLAKRRGEGYPLQYLLGEWEFYGLPFKVGEGVLIPRPDTEALVDTVIEHFRGQKPEMIDLCSGSGCIAVALQKNLPGSKLIAVELSSDALPYLVENIRRNQADVKILKGDVMDGRLLDNFMIKDSGGDYRKLDCIVSNPPYLTAEEMSSLQKEVTFEPASALDGGNDGLKFYRVIACLWREILKDGGLLAFEIGYEQGKAVSEILERSGYENIRVIKDLGGRDRVVTGIKSLNRSDARL